MSSNQADYPTLFRDTAARLIETEHELERARAYIARLEAATLASTRNAEAEAAGSPRPQTIAEWREAKQQEAHSAPNSDGRLMTEADATWIAARIAERIDPLGQLADRSTITQRVAAALEGNTRACRGLGLHLSDREIAVLHAQPREVRIDRLLRALLNAWNISLPIREGG